MLESGKAKEDLIILNLTPVDAKDRDEWRRRTPVADPSPEGFTD